MIQGELHFDGPLLEAEDHVRLGKQMSLVVAMMSDGQWHTLREISEATGCPEASISARLRDLRKDTFGNRVMESRRRRPGKGTWEYRVPRILHALPLE